MGIFLRKVKALVLFTELVVDPPLAWIIGDLPVDFNGEDLGLLLIFWGLRCIITEFIP